MTTWAKEHHRSYKINDEGERILIANFTAEIIKEIRIVDGMNTETFLILRGMMPNPEDKEKPIKLHEVEVAANEFAGMSWVMRSWGTKCLIQPGSGNKEDLRCCIQMYSRPEVETIYRHVGWTEINGKKAYLHKGGAITAKGNDDTVTVRLPAELNRYDLTSKADVKDGFRASLGIASLPTPEVGWVLWAATYAPLFGPVDFATHLAGRSGTFKSELISLFQSHYGTGMDARHLPGSWSSTANALEAQAYCAANAAFVVDDFVPIGTTWQIRAYQTTADKLIRAQGNQAGRSRLTDTSSLQGAYYPRGIILSTGEDTPEGHSIRARMMILEMTPGDIDPKRLTKAQAMRHTLTAPTAALITDLCRHDIDIKGRSEEIRNKCLKIGHTRTPPMIGKLVATAEAVLQWATVNDLISVEAKKKFFKLAFDSIIKAGEKQQHYLESADPIEIFKSALRQALGAGQCHLRTQNGGIPARPTMLGWTEENSYGDLPTYKSHGPCIGWINWQDDELYLEANIGFALVKRIAGSEMPLTKQTLFKRMKDAGALARTDEGRQRNTVRITAENHPRNVICLSCSGTLETQEMPNDEEQPPQKPEPLPINQPRFTLPPEPKNGKPTKDDDPWKDFSPFP